MADDEAGKACPELTTDVLHQMYVQEGRTILDIAKQLGCLPRDVVRYLVRKGLPMRRPRLPKRPVALGRYERR